MARLVIATELVYSNFIASLSAPLRYSGKCFNCL